MTAYKAVSVVVLVCALFIADVASAHRGPRVRPRPPVYRHGATEVVVPFRAFDYSSMWFDNSRMNYNVNSFKIMDMNYRDLKTMDMFMDTL